MNLLRLLLAFLCLPVDGEPDPPADDATPPPEDAGTGDDTLDDLIDAVDTTPRRAPAADDENPIVKEARDRADKAERELAELRARPPAPAPLADRDPEYDREESSLAQARRDGADENTMRWMQWQVDQSRRTRAAEKASTNAVRTSQDMADRADFRELAHTKPNLYKLYADRVEKDAAEWRAKGVFVPRIVLLDLAVGKDAREGKLKPKKRIAPTAGSPAPASTVDRGRMPGVRTDVRPGKGSTESEKRRARLANTPI